MNLQILEQILEAIDRIFKTLHKEDDIKLYVSEELKKFQEERNKYNQTLENRIEDVINKIKIVDDFIEETSEINNICYKSEAMESRNRLLEIEKRAEGMALCKRINTEIRRTDELISQLPDMKAHNDPTEDDIIRKLEENAPICPKCNISMQVRQGPNAYFFGCKNYYKTINGCTEKVWLTKDQKDLFL